MTGNRYVAATFLLCFLIVCNTATSSVLAQNRNDYLIAAEKAANWLASLERTETACQGLSWPISNLNNYRAIGLDVGAVGIGTFYLKLYQTTGNPDHLDRAKRASNFINSEYRSGHFNGPDWLSGAASGGNFFVDLFKETGDLVYLRRAEYVADWLIETAYLEGDGCYWKHDPSFIKIYTGIAHGAAGIGLFFLNLLEQSGNPSYLQQAQRAFNWLENHYIRFSDNSVGWKRLTNDDFVYHLWCGGSTGIFFFLSKFYEMTGEERYLDYLTQTANGLVDYAMSSTGGSAWHYTTGGSSYPIAYCHGTTSTAHALFEAYSLTQKSEYLACARQGARWVMGVKKTRDIGSFYWPHIYQRELYDTGYLTGTASVGHAFVEYYRNDPDSTYLEYATAAANWLLDVADTPSSGQLRWINYTNPEDMDYGEKAYFTGWYEGVAGIGIFMLEVYEALAATDQEPSEMWPERYGLTVRNYPNPFNASTTIEFIVPYRSRVSIEIFNAIGQRVANLTKDQEYSPGVYSVVWDGRDDMQRDLGSGVYLVHVRTAVHSQKHKILLLK